MDGSYLKNINNMRGYSVVISRKKTMLVLISFVSIFAFLYFVVGFRHIPSHMNNLKEFFVVDIKSNVTNMLADPIESDTSHTKKETNGYDIAIDASKVTFKHSNVTYPFDTKMSGIQPHVRKEELDIIKNSHFEKLVKTKKYPTLEEARIALIDAYPYFTHYWIEDNLRFKVGVFYDAMFKDSTNCVSGMIALYDSKTNEEYTSEAATMLESAYDFFQYKNTSNGRWYVKHISQNIPFDNKLFEKYRY